MVKQSRFQFGRSKISLELARPERCRPETFISGQTSPLSLTHQTLSVQRFILKLKLNRQHKIYVGLHQGQLTLSGSIRLLRCWQTCPDPALLSGALLAHAHFSVVYNNTTKFNAQNLSVSGKIVRLKDEFVREADRSC